MAAACIPWSASSSYPYSSLENCIVPWKPFALFFRFPVRPSYMARSSKFSGLYGSHIWIGRSNKIRSSPLHQPAPHVMAKNCVIFRQMPCSAFSFLVSIASGCCIEPHRDTALRQIFLSKRERVGLTTGKILRTPKLFDSDVLHLAVRRGKVCPTASGF